MLASFEWLRALCPVDVDAARIAEALTSRGLTVDSVKPVADDVALEIDVPANRPDCLGHLGLAREVAAAFGANLRHPQTLEDEAVDTLERVRVEIDDPALCARYTATIVRGVRVGPSPDWVVRRLETCGLRSINTVVDASNLVLLELGNPIHFFDLPALDGAMIRVRRARAGEKLRTLDGTQHDLTEETLVIADAATPVAVAGVMGGFDSEINESTTDVLVEAAWFSPQSVRRTARRLGLSTDASHRFERGVDIGALPAAQALARRLLVELAGGREVAGIIDAFPAPLEPRRLNLRPAQIGRLLGYQPQDHETLSALGKLDLQPRADHPGCLEVTVPSWRVDLEREADLVEEVARHLGYDRIPVHQADAPTSGVASPDRDPEEIARDVLGHLGFHEALGYSMIARDQDAPFLSGDPCPGPISLTNPIAESLACLRRSILPGLLQAVDLNQRRGQRDVRLFEIGHVFLAQTGKQKFPDEPSRIGLAWSGAGEPRHWSREPRMVDLFDVIGIVEQLLLSLRPEHPVRKRPEQGRPGLHPGQSLVWQAPSGKVLAWAGAVHPSLQQEMPHGVYLAEIDATALSEEGPRGVPTYTAVPRLTAASRDLALVLTEEVSFSQVLECLGAAAPPAPVSFQAIDRYQGPPLGEGEASVTLRLTLRPQQRTLTDGEIETYREQLVLRLREDLGLKIRDC